MDGIPEIATEKSSDHVSIGHLDPETFRVDLSRVHRKLFHKFRQEVFIFVGGTGIASQGLWA